MAMWPESYEALREEARAVSRAAAEQFTTRTSGLDADERLAVGRKMLDAQQQDGPGGRDEVIAGVPCRVFDPAGEDRAGTYLHLHGGALMWGSPRMNDNGNSALATTLGVRVVSVGYRLAPEHPYPSASDDCLAVAQWVMEHESGPIAVGGESAGGYFTALTLLRIRDDLGAIDRIAAANLVFGVYDLTGTPSNRGARASELPDVLEGNWPYALAAYLPGRSIEDARVGAISPIYADLRGMPSALFTVGHADRLLDDSLFMAARWQAFGSPAEVAVYPDCIHGFTFFPIEMARRAHRRIEGFLASAFGVSPARGPG